jgi:hypothetical protein
MIAGAAMNAIRAEAIARALGLRRVGRGLWRGACPICGGSRRFQLKDGDRGKPLWYCWGGCSGSDIAGRLRSMGLMPEPDWSVEDRRRWMAERRAQEEVKRFSAAARALCQHALGLLRPWDPLRAEWTALLGDLEADPRALAAHFRSARPELFKAMVAAASSLEKSDRRLAARLLDLAVKGVEDAA